MGAAHLPQPDLLPRGRQGPALRRVGATGAFQHETASRLQFATLVRTSEKLGETRCGMIVDVISPGEKAMANVTGGTPTESDFVHFAAAAMPRPAVIDFTALGTISRSLASLSRRRVHPVEQAGVGGQNDVQVGRTSMP
jgi:hypothetical protein